MNSIYVNDLPVGTILINNVNRDMIIVLGSNANDDRIRLVRFNFRKIRGEPFIEFIAVDGLWKYNAAGWIVA